MKNMHGKYRQNNYKDEEIYSMSHVCPSKEVMEMVL